MLKVKRSPNTIGYSSIDLWLKREAETANFQALPNEPRGNRHAYH